MIETSSQDSSLKTFIDTMYTFIFTSVAFCQLFFFTVLMNERKKEWMNEWMVWYCSCYVRANSFWSRDVRIGLYGALWWLAESSTHYTMIFVAAAAYLDSWPMLTCLAVKCSLAGCRYRRPAHHRPSHTCLPTYVYVHYYYLSGIMHTSCRTDNGCRAKPVDTWDQLSRYVWLHGLSCETFIIHDVSWLVTDCVQLLV